MEDVSSEQIYFVCFSGFAGSLMKYNKLSTVIARKFHFGKHKKMFNLGARKFRIPKYMKFMELKSSTSLGILEIFKSWVLKFKSIRNLIRMFFFFNFSSSESSLLKLFVIWARKFHLIKYKKNFF